MESDASTISSWTEDIDHLLEHIRCNAVLLSTEHKKRYFYLKSVLQYFKLPIIIISTFNASLSVGLQPYTDQGSISVITCLLALVCSVIGSIELYLGIQKQMEDSLTLSKDYYHLAVSIYKVLILTHENRPSDSRIVLEDFWNQYTKLAETGHLLDKRVIDKLTEIKEENIGLLGRAKSSSLLSNIPPTPTRSIEIQTELPV